MIQKVKITPIYVLEDVDGLEFRYNYKPVDAAFEVISAISKTYNINSEIRKYISPEKIIVVLSGERKFIEKSLLQFASLTDGMFKWRRCFV